MGIEVFSFDLLLMFFAVALIAGCIDILAGGGGLLTIPVLMVGGLDPVSALATNKLQASTGTGLATWLMIRKGQVNFKTIWPLLPAAFAGALAGAVLIQFIDAERLSLILPVVIFVILLYFIFLPVVGPKLQRMALSQKTYGMTVVPAIGLYDGMLGPGTGSFYAVSGMVCRKMAHVQATAMAKPLNFAANLSALGIFIPSGKVIWHVSLVMIVGQMIGVALGVLFLFRIKPVYLRLIVIVMCLAMLARYVFLYLSGSS